MKYEPIYSPVAKQTLQNISGAKPKKVRQHKTKPFAVWSELCQALDKPYREVCRTIGYASNTWGNWKEDGNVPEVAWFATKKMVEMKGKIIKLEEQVGAATPQSTNKTNLAQIQEPKISPTANQCSAPTPTSPSVFIVRPTVEQTAALTSILEGFSIPFTTL